MSDLETRVNARRDSSGHAIAHHVSWFLAVVLAFLTEAVSAQIFGRTDTTVFAIDPQTGVSTPLVVVQTSFERTYESDTIDASTGRLFLATSDTLYVVDRAERTVVTVALSASLGSFPREIVFDSASGVLFGLTNDGSRIVTIDPRSGIVSALTPTGLSFPGEGSLTIDPAGRRVISKPRRSLSSQPPYKRGFSHTPCRQRLSRRIRSSEREARGYIRPH